MSDEKRRYKHYMPDLCIDDTRAGAQTIVVRQVLGEKEKQKVMDIHVCVPERKPAIEQIIDVFVKNLEVNAVDVIANKVIVRGEFEVKAIYVACLPDKPVHAVELKHCKWTADLDMPGARRGMDADANVVIEFVDYDVPAMTRAYKYKYHGCDDSCDKDSDTCDMKDSCDCHDTMEDSCMPPMKPPHHPGPPCGNPCKPPKPPKPPCGNPCKPPHHPEPPCDNPCKPPKPPKPQKPPCGELPPWGPPTCVDPCQVKVPFPCDMCEIGCREFDVSVVLKVIAKVLVDREVQLNCNTVTKQPGMPSQPKG